jgi:16S rRNA (cytosine1402-N4)-methyltransferase
MPPPRRRRPAPRRSTPAGEHRPVLLNPVLTALAPQPGEVAVDCTLGHAGHARALLERVGPTGRLIGLDWDGDQLPRARAVLEPLGLPFSTHQTNFAGLATVLATEGRPGADVILADLGVSSMQLDEPERGFSYVRDGPLDMRMDRSRGAPAAEVLATISAEDLAEALTTLADEPEGLRIARAVVAARQQQPLQRTAELAAVVVKALGAENWRLRVGPGQWKTHPAARTFQALRILVNRELANLQHLLRILLACLNPGGRAAIISFHSGEDRLVKNAFREGQRTGVYAAVAEEPVRADFAEQQANPRSRSAKLRWARKT